MKNPPRAPLSRGILLALALALPASAARLAYEGFEYTEADGTALSSLATPGGTGWDGNYGSNLTSTTTSVNLRPGLTYTGFASAPSSKSMRFGSSNTIYRPWSGSYATPDTVADGTYWYSFIFRPTAGSRGGTLCPFGRPSDPQNGFGMRMDRGSDVGGNAVDIRFQSWGNNGGGGTLTIANGYDKNYFILGKAVFNSSGNSTNTLWIYTDPAAIPTVAPTSGGIVHTIAFNAVQNSSTPGTSSFRTAMTGRAFSTSGIALDYDEFRVGHNFADVFPSAGPEFAMDPLTAVQNQTLTFNWQGLPGGSNPTLNGNPVTIDGFGVGSTTLPAPATNTTYTLAWTGAGSPLTQNFTAIAPFLNISPSTGYLGDTLTLNWRIPAGSTGITLSPNDEGLDLDSLTISANGIGTAQIPAPTASTTYTINWTGGGAGVSRAFTLNPSFLNVSDYAVAGVSPVSMTWRIPPTWDENTSNNTVELQYGTPADFTNVPPTYSTQDLTLNTNANTGAGSFPQTSLGDGSIIPSTGQTQFRIAYHVGDAVQYVTDTVEIQPEILTGISFSGSLQTDPQFFPVVNIAPMNNGVKAYSDRDHIWAQVPSILQGAQFVKLAQNDKAAPEFSISFTAATDATFFLLLDNRIGDNAGGTTPATGTDSPPRLPNSANSMAWVINSGFVDSGLDIGLDEGANTTIDQSYSVYFRQVSAGQTFEFFQQNDTSTGGPGARNMYGIAAVSPQIVPVAFVANPGTINEGQSTTLQWTVPVGATASIDQNVGAVQVDGVGVGSVPVSPTTTTTYTLTYVLGANSPVSLAPVTVTVIPAPVSGFGTFITGNFGGNTVPSGQQGPTDDPDGDGIDNLVEYAIAGGDPTRSTVSPAVISGTLVTFNKNTSATGITYALEKSSTLGNDWVPATPTTNDANVITYTLAPPTPSKDFVRLKVTQP